MTFTIQYSSFTFDQFRNKYSQSFVNNIILEQRNEQFNRPARKTWRLTSIVRFLTASSKSFTEIVEKIGAFCGTSGNLISENRSGKIGKRSDNLFFTNGLEGSTNGFEIYKNSSNS